MQGCILLMQGCVMLMQGCIENRQACIAVSQVHQRASSAIQSLLARQSFSAIKGAVSVGVLSPLASEGGRQGESCTRRDGRAGLPSGCCILWPAMEGGCYQMDRTELLLDSRQHESLVRPVPRQLLLELRRQGPLVLPVPSQPHVLHAGPHSREALQQFCGDDDRS